MMSITESIKQAIQRGIEAVTLKPAVGLGKDTMLIETDEHCVARITDGDTSFKIDLGEAFGGDATTPSAGQYARAALGACLAQSYIVWAAHEDVTINKVSVEIQAEYDIRGNLGIDSKVRSGITALHYVVRVESPEDPQTIQRLIDLSDERDYVLDIFAGALQPTREIHISPVTG
jgi:uncharacterized OsmC-like protein